MLIFDQINRVKSLSLHVFLLKIPVLDSKSKSSGRRTSREYMGDIYAQISLQESQKLEVKLFVKDHYKTNLFLNRIVKD